MSPQWQHSACQPPLLVATHPWPASEHQQVSHQMSEQGKARWTLKTRDTSWYEQVSRAADPPRQMARTVQGHGYPAWRLVQRCGRMFALRQSEQQRVSQERQVCTKVKTAQSAIEANAQGCSTARHASFDHSPCAAFCDYPCGSAGAAECGESHCQCARYHEPN